MSRSLAARVNEKLYHAGLLIANDIEASDTRAQALQQAQIFAAAAFMQAAYSLFMQEVAESAQIQVTVTHASALKQALAAESRSHAVVETLLSLEADDSSWLSSLHGEYLAFINGDAGSNQTTTRSKSIQMIGMDITAVFDAGSVLDAFKQFVSDQREFLQEW